MGRQNERQHARECRIVSPMCKDACVRDGMHWLLTHRLLELCKTMDIKEGFPLAAFLIAYVAMGLTVRQGGWQRRFALILWFTFSSRRK